MANYITQSDIEDVFGADNVATWSQLDNRQAEASGRRIVAAIAWAEEQVNNRMRNARYAVPIVGTDGGVPRTVVHWAASLAGVWLFRHSRMRQNEETRLSTQEIQNDVYAEIAAHQSGQSTLAAVESGTHPTSPVVEP